eukprot:m.261551 g.261551  ORF g.261551 m.261551 type:complete len:1221 (+) comp15579_c0_seq1:366-4028(+)
MLRRLKSTFRGKQKDLFVQRETAFGLPPNVTCMAFCKVQRIFAVGTKYGRILLFGQPNTMVELQQPEREPVDEIHFLPNKGEFLVLSRPNKLFQWRFSCEPALLVNSIEFKHDDITTMHIPPSLSKWVFCGTSKGNVLFIETETLAPSTYYIPWNKCVKNGMSPGPAVKIELTQKLDQTLILFESGLVVTWNMELKKLQQSFNTIPLSHVRDVKLCQDGSGFWSVHENGTLKRWDLSQPSQPVEDTEDETVFRLEAEHLTVHSVPDRTVIAFSGGEASLTLSSATDGVVTVVRGGTPTHIRVQDNVLGLQLIPESAKANSPASHIAILLPCRLELHNLTTPSCVLTPIGHGFELQTSPVTCTYNVSIAVDMALNTLRAIRHALRASNPAPPPTLGGVPRETLATDGRLIITGHADGFVQFWHMSQGDIELLLEVGPPMLASTPCLPTKAKDMPITHIEFSAITLRLVVVHAGGHVLLYSIARDAKPGCPVECFVTRDSQPGTPTPKAPNASGEQEDAHAQETPPTLTMKDPLQGKKVGKEPPSQLKDAQVSETSQESVEISSDAGADAVDGRDKSDPTATSESIKPVTETAQSAQTGASQHDEHPDASTQPLEQVPATIKSQSKGTKADEAAPAPAAKRTVQLKGVGGTTSDAHLLQCEHTTKSYDATAGARLAAAVVFLKNEKPVPVQQVVFHDRSNSIAFGHSFGFCMVHVDDKWARWVDPAVASSARSSKPAAHPASPSSVTALAFSAPEFLFDNPSCSLAIIAATETGRVVAANFDEFGDEPSLLYDLKSVEPIHFLRLTNSAGIPLRFPFAVPSDEHTEVQSKHDTNALETARADILACSTIPELEAMGQHIKVNAHRFSEDELVVLRKVYADHRTDIWQLQAQDQDKEQEAEEGDSPKVGSGGDAKVVKQHAAKQQAPPRRLKRQSSRLLPMQSMYAEPKPTLMLGTPTSLIMYSLIKHQVKTKESLPEAQGVCSHHWLVMWQGAPHVFSMTPKGTLFTTAFPDLSLDGTASLNFGANSSLAIATSFGEDGTCTVPTRSMGIQQRSIVLKSNAEVGGDALGEEAARQRPEHQQVALQAKDKSGQDAQAMLCSRLFDPTLVETVKDDKVGGSSGGGFFGLFKSSAPSAEASQEAIDALLGSTVDKRDSSMYTVRTAHASAAQGGFSEMREKLEKRERRMQEMQERADEMKEQAEQFGSAAKNLADYYKNKKWWEL